ncbi:mannitol dehydrogenase family protein [Gynuella sunshinyii]|uniref:Mannitol-1-phosphate/altronate dehydrogenase n=1 Tax=Gynuella sunshinyii YC6258 TaxID=1445510 RepID=A0A0C5VUS3_9GAMM|nr:mannitol dehydrogenase family protein [Gynuella sunshinyii]AJQ97053.1 mannitol-1-phosphate/altronate dehydrogenase [Gynuella sunshinyii YC6258]
MQLTHIPSTYQPTNPAKTIVHIGLGAFMRAHLAVYIQRYLNEYGGWQICAANIRSNRTIVEQLEQQHGRYHVLECASSEQAVLREINAIQTVLYAAGEDHSWKLVDRIASVDTHLITLTITEKGYGIDPATLAFKNTDPGIAHDLQNPERPISAAGILVRGLSERRRLGLPGLTILSCDNMPHNGRCAEQMVCGLAERLDPSLAEWIRQSISFPSCMVDRIVPAMTADSSAQLADACGQQDAAGVVCEAFSQWVIEDQFCQDRPDLDKVGVLLTQDVAPFEAMKLRMLNGSHSLLAYLGYLSGFQLVSEAITHPPLRSLIRHYMLEEAQPTLGAIKAEVDLPGYARDLIARFENTSLKHRTYQIAMDGSQKIPQRWLQGAQQLFDQGQFPHCVSLGLTAWLLYTRGRNLQGQPFELQDPMAETLLALHQRNLSVAALVTEFLALPVFASLSAALKQALSQNMERQLELFNQLGLKELLQQTLTTMEQSANE